MESVLLRTASRRNFMKEGFDDAVAKYAEFLKQCGCPQRIIWVAPKDVLFTGSSLIYIKLSVPESNAAAARKEYEAGIASTLGVEFRTLCGLHGATCCFVWFPRDREEAQRMMLPADGGLKMSAKSDLANITSRGVRNWLVWELLKRRHGKKGVLYGYPFGESRGLAVKVGS
jgi:hypothetical protein